LVKTKKQKKIAAFIKLSKIWFRFIPSPKLGVTGSVFYKIATTVLLSRDDFVGLLRPKSLAMKKQKWWS